jgi:hypothetical protein
VIKELCGQQGGEHFSVVNGDGYSWWP